jgi:hypothetical protein
MPSELLLVCSIQTITGILKGCKDRAKSDQSVDPSNIAWAMEALKTFNDPDFKVPYPDEMNEADVLDGIDPNDVTRIDLLPGRNAKKWFLDTWR